MKAYELTAVPIQHSDSWNPLQTILPRLSDESKFALCIITLNHKIKCYFQIDDSCNNVFEQEMSRAGYALKSVEFHEYTTNFSIERLISSGRKNTIGIVSTNINKLGMLLASIQQMQDGCGFALVFSASHQPEMITLKKLSEFNISIFDNNVKNNIFGFSCHPISNNEDCEWQIVNAFSSSVSGVSSYTLEQKSAILSDFAKIETGYIWKNELSSSIAEAEMLDLVKIIELLADYGINTNLETLSSSRKITRPIIDSQVERSIEVGKTLNGCESINIPLKVLRQNMFIAGAPGTGKGNLLFNIANQLYKQKKQKVSFLFIESAKKELHHLRKLIPELQVWRPIPGEFALNPFSIPDGITYEEYKDDLEKILHICFEIDIEGSALQHILPDVLEKCFHIRKYNDDYMWNNTRAKQFGISEFITVFQEVMKSQQYSSDVGPNILQAGINRIKRMLKPIFDSVNSIPMEKLTSGYNVLQLDYLSSMENKQFIASILLIQLNAWIKKNMSNEKNNDLNFVICIDESHNLFKKANYSVGSRITFSDDMENNMLQHRSSGIGYIISDQRVGDLPKSIIESCATKVFLGYNLNSGIRDYLTELQFEESDLKQLYQLTAGTGIIHSPGFERGLPFYTEDLITDLKVTSNYEIHNSFFKESKITVATFYECKNCPHYNSCKIGEKKYSLSLMERFYCSDLTKQFLKALFNSEKEDKKEYLDKICFVYKSFLEEENETSPNTYCFFVQLFRKARMEYGNLRDDIDWMTCTISKILDEKEKTSGKNRKSDNG